MYCLFCCVQEKTKLFTGIYRPMSHQVWSVERVQRVDYKKRLLTLSDKTKSYWKDSLDVFSRGYMVSCLSVCLSVCVSKGFYNTMMC
mgnify:CR=1 FL=1